MNSVLLVGSDRFSASAIAQIRSLDGLAVMTAQSVAVALESMEVALPDVAIVQASYLIDNSVNKTFGEAYSNPYYVLIDEPGWVAAPGEVDAQRQLTRRTRRIVPSVYHLSELYVEEKAIALESGADAYIWRLPEPTAEAAIAMGSAALNGQMGELMDRQSHAVDLSLRSPMSLMSFRKSQQRLIQAHIHIGLNRAQRYRDLSRINDWLSAVALVDALTQLSNRRAFDMELPRQIKVARSKHKPLSLMVIDIDYFKAVNDCHGHLIGDDVLKQLAKRLLANMRFYDAPFRYGGEEFVVTLSSTEMQEAQMIADRLRASIASHPFELEMLADGLKTLDITVSIGLTQPSAADDDKGDSFLHRADQNLLRAKGAGRNRVMGDRDRVFSVEVEGI